MTRETLAALGTFTLIAALGFDGGGYAATAWGWSAIALLVVLAVLVARGIGRPGRTALLFVGSLACLVAWTATSLLWSSDVSATVLKMQRALVYLGAAAVFVLAGRPNALLAGVLAAATLLCGYGLVNWLLGTPDVPLSADPQAAERLSEPIGYANGVAILAAMGLLLSVGFAARSSRAAVAAAAAATGAALRRHALLHLRPRCLARARRRADRRTLRRARSAPTRGQNTRVGRAGGDRRRLGLAARSVRIARSPPGRALRPLGGCPARPERA